MVLLEAWSVGTPVLTSDISPLQSLVDAASGGEVCRRDPVSFAKSLTSLLANPSRLEKLGNSGRQFWLRRFTSERVAVWHLELYRSVLTANGG
jgi:glycosyltransferase involved in cell wall biosynthesis